MLALRLDLAGERCAAVSEASAQGACDNPRSHSADWRLIQRITAAGSVLISGAKINSTADHHCELSCIFFASAAIEALTAAFGESTGGIASTAVYCAFLPSQNCQP